mmetsp:Transcript_105942/g.299509  ORF Transcript_105942/g.299509 Transcript_105942/m.299509 type:complete len:402 (+) Transcript_105942:51-1256(+)
MAGPLAAFTYLPSHKQIRPSIRPSRRSSVFRRKSAHPLVRLGRSILSRRSSTSGEAEVMLQPSESRDFKEDDQIAQHAFGTIECQYGCGFCGGRFEVQMHEFDCPRSTNRQQPIASRNSVISGETSEATPREEVRPVSIRRTRSDGNLVWDWDEELDDEDFEEFDELVRGMHKGFRPPAELVTDYSLHAAVRQKLTVRGFDPGQQRASTTALVSSKHYNSDLLATNQLRPGERERPGGVPAPRLVVVTGHDGPGGNIGINGIYERHPDDFGGRPVYQKELEKRAVLDPFATLAPRQRRKRREVHSPRTRLLLDRSQRLQELPAPPPEAGPFEICSARGAWFLFFDRGYWTIGPQVGCTEAHARCPGAEQVVPSSLANWEVWDVGKKCFYKHKKLRAFKGGN